MSSKPDIRPNSHPRTGEFLIGELSPAASLGTIDRALEPYVHPHVLVVDELGYLTHVDDAANVLYRIVNERYLKRRPILITTNKSLAALHTSTRHSLETFRDIAWGPHNHEGRDR